MTEFGESVTTSSGSGSSTSSSSTTRVLEIGFFFDGTGNNLANARGDGDGSYDNAPSNVALLSRLYSTATGRASDGAEIRRRSVYLQGIGTTNDQPDNMLGMATGTGRTGVSARVHEACRRLEAETRTQHYAEIIVDAFGFSRGAAAARYFVNCVNRGSFEPVSSGFLFDDEPTRLGRVVTPTVLVRFLGIFDSVAAIISPDAGDASDADNDDVNVHLHDGSALVTYHLIAGDEHRRNFALNSIRDSSGGLPTGGVERALPGVHSDVGGGYLARGETVVPVRPRGEYFDQRADAEALRATLVRESTEFSNRMQREHFAAASSEFSWGYNELQDMGADIPQDRFLYMGQVVWRRPNVRPGLEKVALKLMHDEARRNDVPFAAIPSNAEYSIPSDIQSVYTTLSSGGTLSDAQLALLHQNYVHCSAHYGGAAGTTTTEFNTPPRLLLDMDLVYPHIPAPGNRRIIHANRPSDAL
jgi:hypothetical protein